MKNGLGPSLTAGVLIAVLKNQFLNQKNTLFWQVCEQRNREKILQNGWDIKSFLRNR